MPIADAIIAELEREGESTAEMLRRVPSGQSGWRPHAKSMTLGELAWHLASLPAIAVAFLESGRLDLAEARPPRAPGEFPPMEATFRRNLENLRQILASSGDESMKAPFVLFRGEKQIRTMSMIGMLRVIILNHSYHHRGQLSVYLRMLDVPLPAIYGTSADEPGV